MIHSGDEQKPQLQNRESFFKYFLYLFFYSILILKIYISYTYLQRR